MGNYELWHNWSLRYVVEKDKGPSTEMEEPWNHAGGVGGLIFS